MSTTATEFASTASPGADTDPKPPRPWLRVAVAVAAVIVVGVVVLAVIDPFGGGATSSGARQGAYPTSTATVRQGPVSAYADAAGTLGYAAQPDGSPYAVVNRARGVYTALPAPGQVIRQGQPLYEVGYRPVVLLDASAPAARSLSQGDSGPDVHQLNADLVALGYAKRSQLSPSSDVFSSATAAAVSKLQARLGLPQTGSLPLGEAVFLPAPVRITRVTATLGTDAQSGAAIAQATSTTPQVLVNLDAAGRSTVKVGNKALITLPDNQTTPGVVSRIGVVTTSSNGGSSSGSSGATIPVLITLDDPRLAAGLDQAPVEVQITTLTVKDALSVPVTALLAQAGGGYAVETIDARGAHHIVPVTVGFFGHVSGYAQVSGHLYAGERIVVPGT
jgi:peptidoglycan hydrolase-like protein with peptidoglycan-binding domain